MINILLVYNQKRKLTKKLKYRTVDLPDDYTCTVELAKQCDYVKDKRRSVRCKVPGDWNAKEFIAHSLPLWQNIWIKKKVEMTWNARQRSIFLKYIRRVV